MHLSTEMYWKGEWKKLQLVKRRLLMCACNIDIFNHEKINDLNNVYKYNLVTCSLFLLYNIGLPGILKDWDMGAAVSVFLGLIHTSAMVHTAWKSALSMQSAPPAAACRQLMSLYGDAALVGTQPPVPMRQAFGGRWAALNTKWVHSGLLDHPCTHATLGKVFFFF